MESLEDIVNPNTIYSLGNSRRVLTQLRKFTDPATQQTMLLGAESTYGANVMDGKFRVFAAGDLVAGLKQLGGLKDKFYVEVPYGVQCIEHFNLGTEELIVSGLSDGTIQVFDYTKNKEQGSV